MLVPSFLSLLSRDCIVLPIIKTGFSVSVQSQASQVDLPRDLSNLHKAPQVFQRTLHREL